LNHEARRRAGFDPIELADLDALATVRDDSA
jgi:hypothetical protein